VSVPSIPVILLFWIFSGQAWWLSDAEICISDKGAATDVCYYYMLVKSSATKEKKKLRSFYNKEG
jgi:hypothetical protein